MYVGITYFAIQQIFKKALEASRDEARLNTQNSVKKLSVETC